MTTLTIAAAQFAPVDDTEANLATVTTAARDAAARGADLLVTPEYTSYFTADIDDDFVAAAQPLDGPFVSGLREVARETGIALVVGVAEVSDRPDRFRNTLVAVDAAGEVRCVYRKVHLYDAFGSRESDRIEPGERSSSPCSTSTASGSGWRPATTCGSRRSRADWLRPRPAQPTSCSCRLSGSVVRARSTTGTRC